MASLSRSKLPTNRSLCRFHVSLKRLKWFFRVDAWSTFGHNRCLSDAQVTIVLWNDSSIVWFKHLSYLSPFYLWRHCTVRSSSSRVSLTSFTPAESLAIETLWQTFTVTFAGDSRKSQFDLQDQLGWSLVFCQSQLIVLGLLGSTNWRIVYITLLMEPHEWIAPQPCFSEASLVSALPVLQFLWLIQFASGNLVRNWILMLWMPRLSEATGSSGSD